jgi:hypothetical protein
MSDATVDAGPHSDVVSNDRHDAAWIVHPPTALPPTVSGVGTVVCTVERRLSVDSADLENSGRDHTPGCRLTLYADGEGWSLVAHASDRADAMLPRRGTAMLVERLGDLRDTVERAWGEAAWAALLRGAAPVLRASAPAVPRMAVVA